MTDAAVAETKSSTKEVTQDTPGALSWKVPEPDWISAPGCTCDDCKIARAVGWSKDNPKETVYWYMPDDVLEKIEKPDTKGYSTMYSTYSTITSSSTSASTSFSEKTFTKPSVKPKPTYPDPWITKELTPQQVQERDARKRKEASIQIKIDPYVAVSTLYVLSDIQARTHIAASEPNVGIRRAQVLGEYYDELQQVIDEYGSWLGNAFFNYIVITSAGESRYAPSRANFILKNHEKLPVNKGGRSDVYRGVMDYEPFSVLRAIYPVFNCDWIGGGFGGRKWANIVKSGMMYKGVMEDTIRRIPHVVFVDHVADLTHNGGLYFNKGAIFNYPHERYLEMLDVKRRSSIFTFIRQHDMRLYEMAESHIRLAVRLNILKFSEARNRYVELSFVEKPEVVPVPWGKWEMDGQVIENPRFADYRQAEQKKATQASYGSSKVNMEEIDGTTDTPTDTIHFNPPRKP